MAPIKKVTQSPLNKSDGDVEALLQDNLKDFQKKQGKRSFVLPSNNIEAIDQINDDELERRRRKEEAELLEKEAKEKTRSPASKPIFNLLNELDPAQLEEHYFQCLRMCTQNKVNSKNAFKLQLIDCMKLILTTQNKKTENLSLMSCTLDASAKIYSYRVDKVYSDMMKLMSGKAWSDDEGTDADDNGEKEDEEDVPKKKKKSDKKHLDNIDLEKMLWSEARLDKSEADTESTSCINLGRTPLPTSAEFFLDCPLSDADGLLSLNCQLFNSSDALSFSDKILKDFAHRYKGPFDSIDFGKSIPGYYDAYLDEKDVSVVVNDNLVYDKDSHLMPESVHNASLGAGENLDNSDVPMVDYDDCLSDGDGVEPTPIITNHSSRVSVPKASFSVNGMSKLVIARRSEYSFFDESRLNFMAGPAHWSIKNKTKKTQKPSAMPKSVKKQGKIDFSLHQIKKLRKLLIVKSTSQLSERTRISWMQTSHKAPLTVYDHKDIVRLFHDECYYVNKDFKYGLFGSSDSTNINKDLNETLTPDDFIDYCDRNDDDHRNDVDDDDFHQDHDRSPSPLNNLNDCSNVNDTGIDLLPAPAKVNKICLKYAKAQKRINIKLLKSTMWDLMQLENQDTSVESTHDALENSCQPEVKLSEVHKSLYGKLPQEEADQLSFPIVFMAMLHMANEKTLSLVGNDEHSDVTISLG